MDASDLPLLALIAVAGACVPDPGDVLVCHTDAQCRPGGSDDGFCEANGFCSVIDDTCESTRRYHSSAGDLADACADDLPTTSFVENGDFETGLDGWEANRSDLTQSDRGHTLDRSARVCSDRPDGFWNISDAAPWVLDPAVGQVYRAQVWVRTAPGMPAATDVALWLREMPTESTYGAESGSTPIAVVDEWLVLMVEHEVGSASYGLETYVSGAPDSGCYLADDWAVFRVE